MIVDKRDLGERLLKYSAILSKSVATAKGKAKENAHDSP